MRIFSDIEKILKRLSEERPLFHNERDFQLALGIALSRYFNGKITIRMEYPYPKIKNAYADIILLKKGKPIFAIELKFLSKKGLIVKDGEEFNYKRCVKSRREQCIEKDKKRINDFGNGCVIILSNDKRFIKDDWKRYFDDFLYQIYRPSSRKKDLVNE